MNGVTWALGTFHTAVVGIALLLLAYPGGGLGVTLGSLSTISGLAIFFALWGWTVFSTGRAIRGLRLVGADRSTTGAYYRRAMRWGALNGALFLWSFAAILALQQAVIAPGTLPLITLVTGAGVVLGFGSLFAFAIGALTGLALASLDLVALGAGRAIAR